MKFKEFSKATLRKFPFLLPFTDVVRGVTAPREQFALWNDYLKFQQKLAFARRPHSVRSSAGAGKTVCIVLSSDMVYEAKLLAMLAWALRLQGFHVVVFLSKICLWAKRYFRAFGIDEFVYWEDWKPTAQHFQEIAAYAEKLFSEPLTFQGVKAWRYRHAWIGPQILSSAARALMAGSPNPADPEVQKQIRNLLPLTLSMVHIAEQALDAMHPQMLILNEANYALMGALVDTALAQHLDVIQMVQPSRDDALVLKKITPANRRLHPFSVSPETMDMLARRLWTELHEKELQDELRGRYKGKWFLQSRNQPDVKEKAKEELVRELSLDPVKKTAVIFSPVLWDANLFYGDDLFEDFGDWFVQTVKAACMNPSVNWIVKLHPANLWKRARTKEKGELAEISLIKKHIGDPASLPPHVKLLYPDTDISTWSLFENADYGLTVRGTVGIEMPCFGKPVLTGGTGRYSGLGFTIDSKTRDEYLNRVAHIQDQPALTPEQMLLAKKHAHALFALRPWVMKSFRAEFHYKKNGVHPLDSNLIPVASSFDQLAKFGDMEKFAEWAEGASVDYLEQAEPQRGELQRVPHEARAA